VIYSVLFDLMCGIGWVSLRFLLVTFDNLLFNLLTWRVCLNSLIHSSQSFGCLYLSYLKERNHRVFQNMTSNSSILIEKVKLNFFLWLKSKQTIIMIGGNTRFFVWVSTCNLLFCFDGAFFVFCTLSL